MNMSIEHIFRYCGWLWSDPIMNNVNSTAFAKASIKWTQIEHSMRGRRVAPITVVVMIVSVLETRQSTSICPFITLMIWYYWHSKRGGPNGGTDVLTGLTRWSSQCWLGGPLSDYTHSARSTVHSFGALVKAVPLFIASLHSHTAKRIQTFVNSCVRRILGIWDPEITSNKRLWQRTCQMQVEQEIWQRRWR